VSPNIYTLNAFCTKHNFSIQFLVYISHCSIRYFKYFGAFFELRSFFSISVIFNFFLPFFPVCHTVWSGGDMVFFWSLQVCMVIWYGMVWYGMVILEYLIGFFRGGGSVRVRGWIRGSALGSARVARGPLAPRHTCHPPPRVHRRSGHAHRPHRAAGRGPRPGGGGEGWGWGRAGVFSTHSYPPFPTLLVTGFPPFYYLQAFFVLKAFPECLKSCVGGRPSFPLFFFRKR